MINKCHVHSNIFFLNFNLKSENYVKKELKISLSNSKNLWSNHSGVIYCTVYSSQSRGTIPLINCKLSSKCLKVSANLSSSFFAHCLRCRIRLSVVYSAATFQILVKIFRPPPPPPSPHFPKICPTESRVVEEFLLCAENWPYFSGTRTGRKWAQQKVVKFNYCSDNLWLAFQWKFQGSFQRIIIKM